MNGNIIMLMVKRGGYLHILIIWDGRNTDPVLEILLNSCLNARDALMLAITAFNIEVTGRADSFAAGESPELIRTMLQTYRAACVVGSNSLGQRVDVYV